ncbi:MAG TPA: cupin domain-containing protein [Pirellulales bacterium]|nr:cupin domain-containing protein [Pirellulales bacterium]
MSSLKYRLALAILGLTLGLTLALAPVLAQAPAAAAQQAPQAASAPPSNAASNEQLGVDIDRFIGDPANTPVHLSHGTLRTHAILSAGNPYERGAKGAVLEYRKELATATLMPGARTPLEAYEDSYFFYVKSGEGRIDDGEEMWDLREGIAVIAPPHVRHRLVNTSSDKPLEMIMLDWTGGPDAKSSLIVRDTHLLPWCEEDAHWNNTSRCIFSAADGLLQGERIYTVFLDPWSVSQPHSHTPGTEEIWVKISPGTIPILMGSEMREMAQDQAYLVPPNGKTDHSNLNISHDRVESWVYIARGPATPGRGRGGQGGRGGAGRGGRGPANPNLSRDTTDATVQGRPLK